METHLWGHSNPPGSITTVDIAVPLMWTIIPYVGVHPIYFPSEKKNIGSWMNKSCTN